MMKAVAPPPMSDVPSTPAAAALGQRKLIAMLGSAALLGCFTLAFMLGGKKAPVDKDMEKDLQIGMLDASSIDLSAQATPDNWVENTVASIDGAPTEPAPATLPAQGTSAIAQGDAGAAGATPGAATASVASVPTALREGSQVEPHALDVYGREVDSGRKPSNPAGASAGNAHVTPAPPPSPSATTGGSDKAEAKTSRPASTRVKPPSQDSSPPSPQAIPVRVAKVPAKESASAKPVFVRPVHKRPGVVAQTRTLVTEKQYAPPAATKTAKPAAEGKNTDNAPACVRQQEARSYAQQATKELQQKKVLPPTQHVRLPRRAETTNPAVWHEDDTPATADERRPFGLVVAEEKPGFTPEGIPVRTDVPAGTSPLRQNGPDKPLWKRPE